MYCHFCGRPARLVIGPRNKEEGCIAICDAHYCLLEDYLEQQQPQPCCICGRDADATHILESREGDERMCVECHKKLEPDKNVIFKCRCGRSYALLKTVATLEMATRSEQECGWPARDYVGMALVGENFFVKVTSCPCCDAYCNVYGIFLFPPYNNSERLRRLREKPCDLSMAFREIMRHFTGRGEHRHNCSHCNSDCGAH
jgi:hypothetical protein